VSDASDDAHRLARACADAMYAGDRATRALGIELLEVRPGYARARLTVTADMLNGHAICHGGYVFLLADTAFAYACNTHGPMMVASAADIVFTAPAGEGDELVAEAHERTRFGRSGVYDTTVRRSQDGRAIAEFRGVSRTTAATLAE
jgi:acyl-CoA thioesterase